jgi:glyoxylase-like metal-dependent hydrolase (beta-lactamase superfamily II)
VTPTPEEALEQAALAGVHRLPVPTPFAVGKVNAYLIEDEPLTLVDTGPNSGRSLDVLGESLGAHGHAIEDVGLILVTHNHLDHIGLTQIVVEHSGAEVAALGAAARPKRSETTSSRSV